MSRASNSNSALNSLPLWIKIGLTLFACIVYPVYLWQLGPKHLLWLSDIAFLMMVFALWLENRMLCSMVAVGVLPMELAWNVDFFGRLLIGGPFLNFTEYMFDSAQHLLFRGLSLFHVLLPPLVIFLLFRCGYDRRAFWPQSLLSGGVLILSYLVSTPEQNINWVYGPGTDAQTWMDRRLYFVLETLVLFFLVMLPTHLLLKRLFPN